MLSVREQRPHSPPVSRMQTSRSVRPDMSKEIHRTVGRYRIPGCPPLIDTYLHLSGSLDIATGSHVLWRCCLPNRPKLRRWVGSHELVQGQQPRTPWLRSSSEADFAQS